MKGSKKAKGKYILFVYSDDWIDTDTVEKSVEQLEKFDLDLLRFNAKSFIENGN